MDFKKTFQKRLTTLSPDTFAEAALELFRYQAQHNAVYREYLQNLQVNPEQVQVLERIPFLPIEFFKTHDVLTGQVQPDITFYSSGTTQSTRSRHLVGDLDFYLANASAIFEHFYGKLQNFEVLALLPSYLEQGGSSLVAMVDDFMKQTGQPEPGFFLHDHQALLKAVGQAKQRGKKVLLFGVTYALLDLAEQVQGRELHDVIIMETGGMKGRRREMVRAELHAVLTKAFGLETIHSEYGMTELLSQAYSKGNGIFELPPQLRIFLRDPNDPFDISASHRAGGINVIDLANVDSCAFIETKDLGKIHPDGTFEVLGRFDNSDVRGCNQLVAQ